MFLRSLARESCAFSAFRVEYSKGLYSQGKQVYGTFGTMQASSKLVLGFVSALALGCAGDDGKIGAPGEPGLTGGDGTSVLASTSAEPAGPNCATGGIKLETGTDANSNGTLEAGEVSDTQYVCNGGDGGNGGDGLQSLINTTALPLDGVCFFGGVQIDYGIDDDSNGTLEGGEIDGTDNLCNACPYNPAVFVKDFSTQGNLTISPLDQGEVVITGPIGDVNMIANNGLGVIGGATPQIDVGENLLFTFNQPAYNVSYNTSIVGPPAAERSIEAFDSDDASLGTVTDIGSGDHAVSSEFGDVGISSFLDTATVGLHNIRTLEFTFCP